MTFSLTKQFSRDKITEEGADGACVTYEGVDEYIQSFGGECRKT